MPSFFLQSSFFIVCVPDVFRMLISGAWETKLLPLLCGQNFVGIWALLSFGQKRKLFSPAESQSNFGWNFGDLWTDLRSAWNAIWLAFRTTKQFAVGAYVAACWVMKRATKNPLTHIPPRLNAQTCPTQLSPMWHPLPTPCRLSGCVCGRCKQQTITNKCNNNGQRTRNAFPHPTAPFRLPAQIPKQQAATGKQVNTAYQQCQMLHVPAANKHKLSGLHSNKSYKLNLLC